MKNKILKAAAIILFIAAMAAAQTEVWNGTADVIWYNSNVSKDTFFVSNGQELAGMSQLVNNAVTTFANKTIILTSDIDLDNHYWTPIGDGLTTETTFAGVFDGKGHSISNLLVSGKYYAGLFGVVGTGSDAQIKNLVVNVTRISGTTYAGGLAAYYCSEKAIENCGVNISDSISVSSSSDVYCGGLVGYSYGRQIIIITNSYSTGNVSASSHNDSRYSSSSCGGLVGYSGTTTITNSYSTGNVSASAYSYASNDFASSSCGGLLGMTGSRTVTITDSYSTGNVFSFSYSPSSGTETFSGGLVGTGGEVVINNSYSTGNTDAASVSSNSVSYSGGLVGEGGTEITNSYSTGNVSTAATATNANAFSYFSSCGGLVGKGGTEITNSYSTGNVSNTVNVSDASSITSGSGDFSGGLIGFVDVDTPNLTNCYASGIVSGTSSGGIYGKYLSTGNLPGTNASIYYNTAGSGGAAGEGSPSGILGLSSAQLKNQTSFVNWDFENIWGISTEKNSGYPYLRVFGGNDGGTFIAKSARTKAAANIGFTEIRNGRINLNLKAGAYTAQIYNLQGRLIKSVDINADGVNAAGLRIDNLSKGIFILNVKQAGASVLKQKITVK